MARLPDDHHVQRLDGLHDELDRLRQQIDAARNAAFDRRKTPDRGGRTVNTAPGFRSSYGNV